MFSRVKHYVDTVRREVDKKVFRKPFPIGRITERSLTLMSLQFNGLVCVCVYIHVRVNIYTYRNRYDRHGIYSEVVTLYHYKAVR